MWVIYGRTRFTGYPEVKSESELTGEESAPGRRRLLRRLREWLRKDRNTIAVCLILLALSVALIAGSTRVWDKAIWKWLLLGYVFVDGILKVFKAMLPSKSRLANRMDVFLTTIAVPVALWGIYSQFSVEPALRQPGELRPRMSSPESPPDGDRGGYTLDDRAGLFEVRGFNVVFQPLGLNVPFSVCRTTRGLMVSAIVHDTDGKEVAKIINNRWVEFPKRLLRKNFDAHAIEVLDEYGVPIFQIDYVNPFTIRFGGIFKTEFGKCSEIIRDVDFPSASGPPFAMSWLDGGFILVRGAQGTSVLREGESKREELRATAKLLIEPFFDYADSGRLGVRRPSDKVALSMHVPLTDYDRTKYKSLTNSQLREQTRAFVTELHEFADRVHREGLLDDQLIDQLRKFFPDTNSTPKMIASVRNDPALNRMQAQTKKEQAEYAELYRQTALILRTELRSRLPERDRTGEPLLWYENPTNSFGYHMVADDLDQLAKRLP